MELTNLLFSFLIAFIIITGVFTFYNGMAVSYPNVAAADSGLSNLSQQMSVTAAGIDSMTNSTLQQSVNTRNLDVGILGTIAGYATGAINSLATLITIPSLFLNLVSSLAATSGLTSSLGFVIQAIGTAVMTITMIGILFYLLKVK